MEIKKETKFWKKNTISHSSKCNLRLNIIATTHGDSVGFNVGSIVGLLDNKKNSYVSMW